MDNSGTNKTSVAKAGSGTWILSGANTYTGTTTIGVNGGKLVAGAAGALGSGTTGTSSITVNNGGTLLINDAVGSSADHVRNDAAINLGGTIQIAGGADEGSDSAVGLGVLTLSGNSTLDFDVSNGNLLSFASGFAANGFTLNILNWTSGAYNSSTLTAGGSSDDRLIFHQNMSGSLSSINFGSGFTTTQVDLGNGFFEVGGEMSAVPEPSTVLGALALLGLVGYKESRRWRRISQQFTGDV